MLKIYHFIIITTFSLCLFPWGYFFLLHLWYATRYLPPTPHSVAAHWLLTLVMVEILTLQIQANVVNRNFI